MRWWKSKNRAWQKAIAKDSPSLLIQLYQQEGLSAQKAEYWLYQALCHHHWNAGLWLIENTHLNVNIRVKDGKWIEHSLLWIAAIEEAPDSLLLALIQKGAFPFEQHPSHLSTHASPFAIFWNQKRMDVLSKSVQSIDFHQNQHSIYLDFILLMYEMQNALAREILVQFLTHPQFSLNEWFLPSGIWHYFSEAVVLFINTSPLIDLKEIMRLLKEKGASQFYQKQSISPLLDMSRCGSITVFEDWKTLHSSENWAFLPLSKLLLYALQNASNASIEYYFSISSKIEDWVDIQNDGSPLQKAFRSRPDVYDFMMNYIHVQEEKWALNESLHSSESKSVKKRL